MLSKSKTTSTIDAMTKKAQKKNLGQPNIFCCSMYNGAKKCDLN